MNTLIEWAVTHRRTTLLVLAFLLIGGLNAWLTLPRESAPDIPIPIIYVSMSHEGISPEDAERLLLRPMEQELQSIEGVKEMRSTAGEGHASVTLEFEAGFDADQALQDVRDKVDLAKTKLPAETDEPEVHEINVALFPVLSIGLSGPLPERQLVQIGRQLQDAIEALPGVLEAEISGNRDDVLEVIVDPQVMETYHLNFEQILNTITANNRLVAAGAIDNGAGRLVMKVPGVIDDVRDILDMPVKTVNGRVLRVSDVAQVRQTFKDPQSFARLNGQPAITLEVKKRVGANIVETIDQVKQVIQQARPYLPGALDITYTLDQSHQIQTMVGDLNNNVLTAIVLVMVVVIAALGVSAGLLVGVAIPASFLMGLMVLSLVGYTLNMVVLFSLILVVGMLVDGAIVVTELATRYREAGQPARNAFLAAAQRMAWPVFSSMLTTIVVFLPLMAWPGVVGEFMKFLPATVMICLSASLLVALLFLPTLGSLLRGKPVPAARPDSDATPNLLTRGYLNLLDTLLRRPKTTLAGTLLFVAATYVAYFAFNHGVEFFPDVEPESAQILIHARGDLSIYEKDALVKAVEKRVVGHPEIKAVSARSFNRAQGELAADVIGVLQFEFIDWNQRRPARVILDELKARTADLYGIGIEFRKAEEGPSAGKPIQLQVSALNGEHLEQAADAIEAALRATPGLVDLEDDRALPGIEWRLLIDRAEAGRYGANVASVGSAVQLVTNGLTVSTWRPEDSDDEVDIRVRYPAPYRGYDALRELRLETSKGLVPVSNFVTFQPGPKTGTLHRVDGRRAVTFKADVAPDALANDVLKAALTRIQALSLPADVRLDVKGENEDMQETGTFLAKAFGVALFLMVLVLVTQFNSFYQTALVMSAIVLSTAGVLIGLLVTGQPFGVVMVGLGIIALGGIVVNNNIVLIDTYNQLIAEGYSRHEAALETGRLRLRPVLLTAGTTALGLMPMVLSLNIDLIHRSIEVGAPSTQWWTQLSTAIAGGLTFATFLTLLLTPCMLVLARSPKAELAHGIETLHAQEGPDEHAAPVRAREQAMEKVGQA